MKIKSYILVKAGEVFLVIITLILILAFKLQAQERLPSEITRNEIELQINTVIPNGTSSYEVTTFKDSINNNL